MHLFKAKVFKLALSSIALAFLVVVINQTDLFSVKIAQALITSNIDNCSLADNTSSIFNKSGGNCQIFASQASGLGAGQNLTLSNGAKLVISLGAELILAPETKIILDSAGTKGSIEMLTGGDPAKGIHRGYLCAPDADGDGYISSAMTSYTKVLSSVVLSNPCPGGYTEKSLLKPINQIDCNDNSYSTTNTCCTTGYRDYDKDGSGLKTDTLACYAPSALYNVVANNADCDDGNPAIYNGWSAGSFCGVGTCGGSGTDSCTNGVRTDTCTTSPKACCNAGVGTYKSANICISNCLTCSGAAADPINQTSGQDLCNVCATGGLGSGTSCQDNNCSGTSNSCGVLANTTICNYGGFGAYSGAVGCIASQSRNIYKCGAGTGVCSGSSSGADYNYQYATVDGNIWDGGSSWITANSATNAGVSSPYTCSGLTSVIGSFYGCAVGSNSVGAVAKGTKATGTTCSGTEANMCVSGNSACVNNCSVGGASQSGSAYTDNQNSACYGYSQCTSGTCCNANNGAYCTSGNVWNGSTCVAGICSAAGTTCNPAESCTGAAATCPTDAVAPSSTLCSDLGCGSATGGAGVCTTSYNKQNCGAGTGLCNGSTTPTSCYAITSGYVWNGSAWGAASTSNNCSITGYQCSGQQIYRGYNGCALGSNTCNVGYTSNNALCAGLAGESSSRCVAPNSTCLNQCSDAADNDADGWVDSLDKGCNASACEQCKPSDGPCCDSNGCFLSGVCRASAGSCDIAESCTGGSAACPIDAFKTNVNICSTGSFNNPAANSCQRTATDQYCLGTAAGCTGSTNVRYDNAPSVNNIWNGAGSWIASNATNYCGTSAANSCSGLVQTQKDAYGCNTSGSCGTVANGSKVNNGVICSGAESDLCQGGACINKCVQYNSSYPGDDNANGIADVFEAVCGSQCSSGACCDTSTGTYRSSSYVCNASVGSCDIAETCTGASNLCPSDAIRPSTYICLTGSFDNYAGSCRRTAADQYCSGSATACNGNINTRFQDTPTPNYVYNGSTWSPASISNYCGVSGYQCSGQQIYQNYYGCNANGVCNYSNTSNNALCTGLAGESSSRCVASNSTCQAQCSDTADNDADGWVDSLDKGCNASACEQCKPSDGPCCNSNGCFISGTQCRAGSGTCNPAETCSGASALCPTDAVAPSSTLCSDPGCGSATGGAGVCATSYNKQNCGSGTGLCNGSTTPTSCYGGTDGKIWNGSAWTTATCALSAGYSAYSCSGNTTSRSSYGCAAASNSVGSVAQASGCNSTTCTGAENSMCANGSATCVNNCSVGGSSQSGSIYTDNQNSACYGYSQCTAGACCNTANGRFSDSSTICSDPGCGSATASAGLCMTSYNRRNCSGSEATCTNGTNNGVFCYAPTNNNVWNGSAWAAASSGNKCNSSSTCSGNTQVNNNYFGCAVGSNTCNVGTAGATTVGCSGAENQMCVAGNSSCQNMCTAGGPDNNGNGYNDGQDAACGGCSQCTSGTCCNTATGCYNTAVCRASAGPCDVAENCSNGSCPADALAPSSTTCYSGSCASPSAYLDYNINYCNYTYNNQKCSGSSASCNGILAASGANCYCPSGSVWDYNSKACLSGNSSVFCGVAAFTCQTSTILKRYLLNCNGSGTCNQGSAYLGWIATCSAPSPFCAASPSEYHFCDQCQTNSQCGADGWVSGGSCSGNSIMSWYRTYSCSSGSCYSADTQQVYSACTGGENSRCVDGYSTCQNLCNNGINDDNDCCMDSADSDCGGGGQCLPGTGPCCSSTGWFITGQYTCSTGYCPGNSSGCTQCTGATYPFNGGCSSCLAGSYCAGGIKTACPAGSWSSSGQISCTTCAKGTYNASTGQTSCTICPVGQTTLSTGATSSGSCYVCGSNCN